MQVSLARGAVQAWGPASRGVACAPRTLHASAPRLRSRPASRARQPSRVAPLASLRADSGTGRTADTRLGELFLRLLPGQLYYLPAFLYPLVTAAAGLGAAYAPALVQWAAALPLLQALGPLSPLLHQLATTQPGASLLSLLASLLTVFLAFVAMPTLDWMLGRDLRNPSEAEAVQGAKDALFRAVLYVYCPVHIAMLAAMCHLLSTTAVAPLAFVGATLSAGVSGGILFTAAHELLHGTHWLDKLGANALLAAVGYMHWTESHLAHHVKVATPEDPASARPGESLYHFIPRSVWGNLVDGYRAEARRLAKRGIPLLSLRNRMLYWVTVPVTLAAAVFVAFGWKGLAFAVGQAVVSIIMLETVNYLEHYGLQRRRLPVAAGSAPRYERVGAQHSWNTSYMFTSAATFRLQRHADHHVHGSKPYHLLRDIPEAPQLPFSYPAIMTLALVPPLFFRVMDPRVAAYAAARQQQELAAAAQ